ncbi:Plus3 domain-containing protein [Mycena kentingensis (nom. inval.)]|nr:Plus3 domain-containing protein [Mycena kentingensis (nom. inval.)]
MSSEFDDELLELVDGTERERVKKRARESGSGKGANKKRKTADSDAEPESEDGDDAGARPRNGRPTASNEAPEDDDDEKYPLEGKYIDEADREELLAKTEIERENILTARLDEMESIRDRKHLEKAAPAADCRRCRRGRGQPRYKEDGADGRKGPHQGPQSDCAQGQEEGKGRKEEGQNPSSPRPRSGSPDDMDMSMSEESGDDDDAKGDARDRRPVKDKLDEPMSFEALRRITLTRDDLVKHSTSPFFENILVGAWVRYCIGNQNKEPVYRLCQIRRLVPAIKPYEIERGGRRVTMLEAFELKHGTAEKVWSMAQTSNAEVMQEEYDRIVSTYAADKIGFPTTREATERHMDMQKYVNKVATEEDITSMIARKRGNAPTANSRVLERSRLIALRKLAVARQDSAEVVQIDEQLKVLNDAAAAESAGTEAVEDKLARVNERNRKANMEAVRKAEIEAAEKKRRQRKAAAQGGGSGTSTPTQKNFDPSARLRTVPRVFENVTPGGSRPSTPNPTSTPPNGQQKVPVKASLLSGRAKTMDAVAKSIEIDLGDF